jgi:rod shape-determining protein MreD
MRPADLTPLGREAMRAPVGAGFIFASFAAAYLLAVLPWSGGWLLARPDFVLLVLAFWALHEPRFAGQGLAFAMGLMMDVSDSMLLGQHAFTYVIAVYATQVLRVRILAFRLPEQTLHMAGIFAAAALVMLALNLLLGAEFPGFAFLLSPALTAAAWAPASWLLLHPMMSRSRSEVPS